MNKYYHYLDKHVDTLISHNYKRFTKSKYFSDHLIELVNKYNLVGFYKMFKKEKDTNDECIICCDNIFKTYIQCSNGHVVCEECFKLCKDIKTCSGCIVKYIITDMYFVKP